MDTNVLCTRNSRDYKNQSIYDLTLVSIYIKSRFGFIALNSEVSYCKSSFGVPLPVQLYISALRRFLSEWDTALRRMTRHVEYALESRVLRNWEREDEGFKEQVFVKDFR